MASRPGPRGTEPLATTVPLRRQVKRPEFRPSDRALLALLSQALPRWRWSIFLVTPDTLLGAAIATLAGEPLRSALLAASALGLPSAVPLSAFGDTPEARTDLRTQATVAQVEARRRLAQLQEFPAPAPGDKAARAEHAVARIRTVFGGEFRAVPRYAVPPSGDPAQVDATNRAGRAALPLTRGARRAGGDLGAVAGDLVAAAGGLGQRSERGRVQLAALLAALPGRPRPAQALRCRPCRIRPHSVRPGRGSRLSRRWHTGATKQRMGGS